MPELPEVETVRRGLEPRLTGRTIEAADIRDGRLTAPRDPLEVSLELGGERVSGMGRRGKYLLFELDSGRTLVAHLRKVGADSLIICGESTSGCVRASTVDAYSYGFHNVVVEECTYDRSLLSHKVNLFDLHHKYADVMHLDEVLEHLAGLAGARTAA